MSLLVGRRISGGPPRNRRGNLTGRSMNGCYPLVSAVIPTRNRLGFLQEAVESARRQTYANWELIVVDDASEDGTWVWLCSLNDLRIRTFRLEHRSERSIARNQGLSKARGEFALFLDDDDLLQSL